MAQVIDSRKVDLVALPGIEPGFEDWESATRKPPLERRCCQQRLPWSDRDVSTTWLSATASTLQRRHSRRGVHLLAKASDFSLGTRLRTPTDRIPFFGRYWSN